MFLPLSHLGCNYLVSVGLTQPQVTHLPLGECWLGDSSGSCLEQRASTPSPALGVTSKQTGEATRRVCALQSPTPAVLWTHPDTLQAESPTGERCRAGRTPTRSVAQAQGLN